MKFPLHSLSLLFIALASSAQEKQQDSIKSNGLDEVVVTAQFQPQAIDRSVFNVKVISRKDIERQAAVNLADLLNQSLNISVDPDRGQGRSTVSMFGLDGQYIKFLIDNIPVVSDTGLGNNIDLTQINLDDIERIEIIEGSMGVTNGANAVTGIINIITRRGAAGKWEITASAQEETAGKEYGMFDQGRHIQALRIAHNLNANWYVTAGGNRNDFRGFQHERGGIDFTESPPDPNLKRGFEWLPKTQYVGNALLGYKKGNFNLSYKFDILNEVIDFYNPIIREEENYPFDPIVFSDDRRYITNRFFHHLNANGILDSGLRYNISVSQQKQERDFEDFRYLFASRSEDRNERLTYHSTSVLYSTGTLSNFFTGKKADLQLGYEIVHQRGFASARQGMFFDENNRLVDKRAIINNYDLFAVAEYHVTDKTSIRPGFRYSAQTLFEDQYSASLGVRHLLPKQFELRLTAGRSYRTPNFDELYVYFVDSNHDLRGNPDLIPETSLSLDFSIKKRSQFGKARLFHTLNVNYLNVNDRISTVLINTVPTWQYKSVNIDTYRMWNFALANQFVRENFEANLGLSLVRVSQNINTGQIESDDAYLDTFQLNANVAYTVPKWATTFSLYYKLNGKQQQLVQTQDAGNQPIFAVSEVESYGWLDGSVKKSFFGRALDVTLGGRNLLDVVNIQSSIATGNVAHGAASNDISLGYGRMFFLKLQYNFNL